MARVAVIRDARLLRERNFRRFFFGYSTLLLGSSMSSIAIAFAVLDSGGNASSLAEGWTEFRSRTWLLATTLQYTSSRVS